ncbi:MAG: helix-turn-helix transcriptional regulator, partial [Clostridia bacterium]|nr:helix-turn-helix transcriptional regulator [Clostridia bacterium]
YLCRLFKSYFGITPLQYVFQKKMDYSRNLLLYTQISISEIAAMVGYDDISHFSKDFKKYSHCPPRYFRSRTLKERQWQFPYRL